MRYPAIDLVPGDRYIHRDPAGEGHVVTVLARLADETDRFEQRVLTFKGTADGREGIVFLGERASVDVVTTND